MSFPKQLLAPWSRKLTTVERERSETNEAYGCRPEERKIEQHINNGVISLDKPSGPTSHEVVAWLKKMLGVNLAGHSGTLDAKGRSPSDRMSACMHCKCFQDN